ncbi:MAG TPA: glycogen/starch synthase [bacterium]|nr:glycogen/starch synthase [bacterium]
MRILFATMEVAPFSKVGGLGDVAKALPQALSLQDVAVTIITPWYRTLPERSPMLRTMQTVRETSLALNGTGVPVRWLTPQDAGNGVELIFVDEPRYLSRNGPYVSGGESADFPQQPEASILFAKAIADWVAHSGRNYTVVHLNEHHTALAAPMLKQLPHAPSVVLTVHNFGHQGVYDASVLPKLGLPREWYYPGGPLEFYDKVNFLKAGVWFSDAITTVSETYRQEVMTQYEYGLGLEGVMRTRADHFFGVINGIDDAEWSPRTSPYIAPHFSESRLDRKHTVKARLLAELGLPAAAVTTPLVAVILRLVEQKGIDLILAVAERLLGHPALLVVMGEGNAGYQASLRELEARHPDRCRVLTRYEEGLAHRITAGADIFLMPSRFEPCGLNQLYSLAFGTVPVVRHTGGLADTIIDARYHPESGTGFSFRDPTPQAFWRAVSGALEAYRDRPRWRRMMRRGMREVHAWEHSARAYIAIYHALVDGQTPRVA